MNSNGDRYHGLKGLKWRRQVATERVTQSVTSTLSNARLTANSPSITTCAMPNNVLRIGPSTNPAASARRKILRLGLALSGSGKRAGYIIALHLSTVRIRLDQSLAWVLTSDRIGFNQYESSV
jgi:hypothetical protein